MKSIEARSCFRDLQHFEKACFTRDQKFFALILQKIAGDLAAVIRGGDFGGRDPMSTGRAQED